MTSDSMIALEWFIANKVDPYWLKHWYVEGDTLKFEYKGKA